MFYRLANRLYEIRCFFNPRNKWATKCVPKTWLEKPELVKDIIYASVIDFVEVEKGLMCVDYSEIPETERMIFAMYHWAKSGRINCAESVKFLAQSNNHSKAYSMIEQQEKMDKTYLEWYIKNIEAFQT